MKKLLFIFSIVTLSLFSCTDLDNEFYDRIPDDAYTPDPVVDMIPIYLPMKDMVDDNGCWLFGQELTADGICAPTRGEHWDDGGKWRVLHQHAWDNNVETVNKMWSMFYNGIAEANKFIEIQNLNAGDSVVDVAIAKAKIMRAFYYYLLIDNYGDVPYVTQFMNAEEKPFKSLRAAIYDSILNTVEANVTLLPFSTSKNAVNKGMAYCLLAKLYLNHAVYTGVTDPNFWVKAEAVCDSVIALGQYSLESEALAPFVTNNDNSPENIFVIPFDEDSYTGFRLHMRTLHYNSNLTYDMLAGPWNGFAAMETHYNLYEDMDARKAGFLVGPQKTSSGASITDPTAGVPLVFDPHLPALVMTADNSSIVEMRMSGARVVKFEVKKGAKENLSNNFPIFRFADVLLMKAEAMIRQGLNGDSYVNEIRSRAGVSTWTGVTLEMLLEERAREMFCEGHRRQDLIRFGKFNDAWWEKLVSTPDRNTFPIPQWAIDANPNLGN